MLTLTTLYAHGILCGHTTYADGSMLTLTTLYAHDMLCGHTAYADGDILTLTTLYAHDMLCGHTTCADGDTLTLNLIFIYTVNLFWFHFEFFAKFKMNPSYFKSISKVGCNIDLFPIFLNNSRRIQCCFLKSVWYSS